VRDYAQIKRIVASGGEDAARDARVRKLLWGSVAVTLLLYLVPFGGFVIYPLLLFATLAHEIGHGITAAMLGGTFEQFMLFADGSGVARSTGVTGDPGHALVAAGGLVGPATLGMVGFVAARRPRPSRALLGLLALGLLAAEILVVRNPFGWLFVGACVAGFAWVAVRCSARTAQTVLVFIAVQLALSVYSTGAYLFTDVAVTGAGTMPSDVANMATALGGPYWLWGLACGGFSLLAVAAGLAVYLRGPAFRKH
jgi:hypothetical protein